MKQKYVNPTMVVVKIGTTRQMLSGSIGINTTDSAVDASEASGRDYDFEDDGE